MVTRAPSFDLRKLLHIFLAGLIQMVPLSADLNSGPITFKFKDVPFKTVLINLIEDHGVSIIFPDTIPNISISASCEQCSETEAVTAVLALSNLVWEQTGTQFTIAVPTTLFRFGVSGRVVDQESGEPIPFVNVYLPDLNMGDISNRDGSFSIPNIPVQSCTLVLSYIGYKTEKIPLFFPRDETLFQEISLLPKVLSSKGVSITGFNREFMDRSNSPGQISFSPRHISTLPNLGEVDIFRSLQFLPGVQLGLGGTSGLYIRGGTPDQNLVILDGMPVYQTGHMFGFISGITADAIKDIQVYKGSIPAQFGGRVSSVIELTSRNGNSLKPHGAFYGNLMSQGISAELPIFSRGSWIVNLRRSINVQSDLYKSIQEFVTGDDKFNLLSQSADQLVDQKAFYGLQSSYKDLISRLSFLAAPRHRFTFTHISGIDSVLEDREYFGFNSIMGHDTTELQERTEWKNNGSILNWFSKWNHEYDSHVSVSRYLYSSRYSSQQSSPVNGNHLSNIGSADEDNTLEDRSIRFQHRYKGFETHRITSGIEESYYAVRYKTNKLDGSVSNTVVFNQEGFLHAFFLQDQWIPNDKWDVQAGYRVSYYNELEGFYGSPRLALKYRVRPGVSLETSLGRHHQFVHRLIGENMTRGTRRMWIISSRQIPCISSLNYHTGLNWEKGYYSLSMNGYYRSLIDIFQFQGSFIPTTTLVNNWTVSNNEIGFGTGTARGMELLLRKKEGMVSGWISYHLNRTKYDFPSLNNGDSFLANHDKMHEFKSVIMTRIRKWDFTATWVYASGRVYTSTENMYVNSGYQISTTGNQNNERLDSIHHLDVSISRTWQVSPAVIHTGLSIYNLYDQWNISHKRYNPYTTQLAVTDVAMFGITPMAFVKISF